MTRKDFQNIAITLGAQMRNYERFGPEYNAIYLTADHLCDDLQRSNPAFDAERFLDYVLDVAEGRRDLTGAKNAA